MSEPFIDSYVVDDDILVVKLHGNLDATNTEQFESEVQKHFDDGKSKMIIDCAHLGYISSIAIGALVALQTRLRRQGGEVKLAAIQSTVAEILKVVRIDRVLNMYGDIEFARQSFHK